MKFRTQSGSVYETQVGEGPVVYTQVRMCTEGKPKRDGKSRPIGLAWTTAKDVEVAIGKRALITVLVGDDYKTAVTNIVEEIW